MLDELYKDSSAEGGGMLGVLLTGGKTLATCA